MESQFVGGYSNPCVKSNDVNKTIIKIIIFFRNVSLRNFSIYISSVFPTNGLIFALFFKRNIKGTRLTINQLIRIEKGSILCRKLKKLVMQKIVKEILRPALIEESKKESDFTLKRKTTNNWM